VVIANTIKGKGVSFMENSVKWHYKPPNDEDLKLALLEVLGAED
jgi:transketolase